MIFYYWWCWTFPIEKIWASISWKQPLKKGNKMSEFSYLHSAIYLKMHAIKNLNENIFIGLRKYIIWCEEGCKYRQLSPLNSLDVGTSSPKLKRNANKYVFIQHTTSWYGSLHTSYSHHSKQLNHILWTPLKQNKQSCIKIREHFISEEQGWASVFWFCMYALVYKVLNLHNSIGSK